MRKNLLYVFGFISIFFILSFVSIGYSAFSQNFSISGDAVVRSIADFRVDAISVSSISNGGSATYNPEYTRNNTSMYSTLPNTNSVVKYEVVLANNSSNCLSVSSITSLLDNNSNITYKIEGLDLNTPYCDKKVRFYITVSTTSSGVNNKEVLTLKYSFVEMKAYTLTNLLVNPSYENGFSPWVSWLGTSNFSVSSEYSLFGTYSAKNNKSLQWDTAGQHFDAVANHKYYGITYMYSTLGECYSQIGFYNNGWNWSYANFLDKLNTWVRVNHYHTAPYALTDAAFITADYPSADRNIICYADGNVLIDLTATFGAGSEPDITWCNDHINYFEGTTTVYK